MIDGDREIASGGAIGVWYVAMFLGLWLLTHCAGG